MKISKLFHWLYASVMFLPLLVAPIFAVYSHRHTINDYQVEYSQNKVVDFNQHFTENTFSRQFSYNGSERTMNYTSYFWEQHVYVLRFTISNLQNADNNGFSVNTGNDTSFASTLINRNGVYNLYGTSISTGSTNYFYLPTSAQSQTITFTFSDYNIFDLTQMFGVGNEPTLEQFNSWYPNQHYNYVDSKVELLKDYQTVTYNNTDIGSQFLYALYITTDQYLNFDTFMNMYQVYDWIELNAFDGNAPLVFNIAWHYMDYWLLVSIFWLCFDVIMYVPLLAHRWLDKASLE